MKKLQSGLFALAIAMIFTACGDNKTETTDTTSDISHTETAADTTAAITPPAGTVDLTGTMGGSNFVAAAASGGMMEVNLGTIAQSNAASKEVKDLAKMIRDDHNKANAELKQIATGKNITVPAAMTSEHQGHVDQMKTLKGADFDKAYLGMMADDHTKDIDMFNRASTSLGDADLKAFAAKTLPTLQKHLDKTKEVQGKMQ